MTPPADDPEMLRLEPEHGGSADFRSFISAELFPWLEANYRTHPYKILVGHSLGGLFAIDSLLSDHELFDAYIAISPSLHWDEQRIVQRTELILADGSNLNTTLYMTAGNEGGALLGAVRQFSGALDRASPNGLLWQFAHLSSETHGSVPLRSIYQGLEFVFSDWRIRDPMQIYREYGVAAIEKFYAASNERYGFDRRVPGPILISIGLELLNSGRIDELAELRSRYPEEIAPPASFLEGRAAEFLENGQIDEAVGLYRIALEIDPDSEVASQAISELVD